MANRKFWLGMLVLLLAFGMTVVGCPDDPTDGEKDTWTDVTSFSQLNGTWKGSYSETITFKESLESMGMEWDATLETYLGSDLMITTTTEITTTIISSAKTHLISVTMTLAYSGSKISTAWEFILLAMEDFPEAIIDNSKHTITMTENKMGTLTDEDIAEMLSSGLQINQNGTKIKLPADFLDSGLPAMIMTKQ